MLCAIWGFRVMVRGGIERYLKTFPEGGYWKGKNYLFDRRFEQVAENAPKLPDTELGSVCCLCAKPCSEYRGQHKCAQQDCKVPVLVCPPCIPGLGLILTGDRGGGR